MTNHDDFRRAIAANPEDEHNYLIYADWLDEHDKPVQAARARWWAGALAHLRSKPTSGAGAMSTMTAEEQERRGLPEWAARLNQVRGVHNALQGTDAANHNGIREAIDAARLHGLGSLTPEEFTQARDRARLISIGASRLSPYQAVNGLLQSVAHTTLHYPPWDAQNHHRDVYGPGARHALHDSHQYETQRLTEYARMNPPPDAQHAVHLSLVSKIRGWFGRTPPARDGRDGIVHAHAENPTAVYAEKNAVAQALRLLGAPEHMSKVDRYTAHIARFVKENPNHAIVKAYKDKAGVIGGTAGPELTDAVKPLVGAVNLLLASHGLDERFKRPETTSHRAAFEHSAATPEAEPAPVEEPPLEPPTESPEQNMHHTVRGLLQEHGGDLNKTKAALKEQHGLSHQEAHEATRAFLALHTGMKGLQAFKRKLKTDPDAKLAKPKPGAKVEPEHLLNEAYNGKPINEALAGTALAFHLRQIGQDHPDLAPLVDRALAREGHVTARAVGGDPYARIGIRLKQKGDHRAGLFNWDTMHDSLTQDARVKALVTKLVTKPYAIEGDTGAERKYWDAVHRGFGQGKAGNANEFWARVQKHGGGLTREQVAASLARLKDRALDREYVQTVRAESKSRRNAEPGDEHWRGVMGAAPTEQHAKYSRES
jgi:uncharacterized protein (TIGR02996 family)